MAITLVITDAGRAALVNAAHDGTNAVRIAAAGITATTIAASAATTTLPGEIKRIATLSGAAVAANIIHLTVQDESSDAYTMRSFALYLADGTLFAAYGQADVILQKTASAVMLLAIDVTLADVAATSITFGSTAFINPSATTDTAGVVELATDAETVTGTDAQRAVTPRGLWAALVAKLASWGSDIWRASNDGSGSGLDADLLDGRDGSAYALLSSNVTFGNVTASGSASSGVIYLGSDQRHYLYYDGANYSLPGASLFVNAGLAWTSGNDGAGSGLDADLLDGRDSSAYAIVGSNVTFGNVVASSTLSSGAVFLGTDQRHYLYFDGANYSMPGANLYVNAGLAWNSGNDGSGSGLDADLLDGLDSTTILGDFGANGNGCWERRRKSDGTMMIEQWGTIGGIDAEGNLQITFPIPFTNAGSVNVQMVPVNSDNSDAYDLWLQRVVKDVNGCLLRTQWPAGGGTKKINAVDWRAIGW